MGLFNNSSQINWVILRSVPVMCSVMHLPNILQVWYFSPIDLGDPPKLITNSYQLCVIPQMFWIIQNPLTHVTQSQHSRRKYAAIHFKEHNTSSSHFVPPLVLNKL